MLTDFGRDASARAAARERQIAEQRALLDAQVREKGKAVDDGGPVDVPLKGRRSRPQIQGGTQILPQFEPIAFGSATIMPTINLGSSTDYMGATGPLSSSSASPLGSPNVRFGRALTEITRAVSEDEVLRRERSRMELVSALEVQVREREARRLVEKLSVWEEEQRDLALMGLQGAGKPRPSVPEDLVPYIEAQAPGFLNRPGIAITSHAPIAARSVGMRTPPRTMPGAALRMAIHEAEPAPAAFDGPAERAAARRGAPNTDAESRLDRILRSVAPSSAVEAAAEPEDAPASGTGGFRADAVEELTSLVRELLQEQRTLQQTLSGRSFGSGTIRGGNHVENDDSAGNHRAEYGAESAPRARNRERTGLMSAGSRLVARTEAAEDSQPRSHSAGKPRLQQQQRNARPQSVLRSRELDEEEPQQAAEKPRSAVTAKRPGFGRHDEGRITAEKRRAMGEARMREAAEKRRADLEDFKMAAEAAKQAKRRELGEQKQLRVALRRGEAGAVYGQSPPLREMLPKQQPLPYSPAAAMQRYGRPASFEPSAGARGLEGDARGYSLAVSPIHEEEIDAALHGHDLAVSAGPAFELPAESRLFFPEEQEQPSKLPRSTRAGAGTRGAKARAAPQAGRGGSGGIMSLLR
jgi:hypothetical protein